MSINVCRKCQVQFEASRNTIKYCDACKTITCLWCGGQFEASNLEINPRYCSLACRSKHRFRGRRVDILCAYCFVLLSRPVGHLKGHEFAFCDGECRTKYSWENHREKHMRYWTKTARDNQRKNRMTQRFPSKMTGIERLLADELTRRGIAFKMHVSMYGRWQPDFILDNYKIVVQADGEYWHRLPVHIERDAKFNAAAKADGWMVLRFWGKQIHNDCAGCVDHVEAAMSVAALRV